MPTKIEWCTETWNPITGCSWVSRGCDNCYAKRMANRLRGRYGYPKDDPFTVTLHPERVDEYVDLPNNHPYRWRKPRMIFVCSMGDFFHPQVPLEFQARMLDVMVRCPQHIFIILTKRHKGLASFNQVCGWSAESYPNIWLGVSVEDQATADERIGELLKVDAAVRVVSYEPGLGPVDFTRIPHVCAYTDKPMHFNALSDSLDDGLWFDEDGGEDAHDKARKIDWVICGGETGPGARPMHPDWPRQVRDQCVAAGVPYFHKQNGIWMPVDTAGDDPDPEGRSAMAYKDGTVDQNWQAGPKCIGAQPLWRVGKKQAGRLLDGREWNEIPETERR